MATWREWIVSDPSVMMGKPVIVGTRITVELILEKLAAGETVEDLLEAHPRLTREAIHAALAFAESRGNRPHERFRLYGGDSPLKAPTA